MTDVKMLYSPITLDTQGGRRWMGGVNGWKADTTPPPYKHLTLSWTGDLILKTPRVCTQLASGVQRSGVKESEAAPGPGAETRRNVLLAASWPLTLRLRPKYLQHLLVRVLMGQGRQPSEAGGGPEALKPSPAVPTLTPPGPYISHMALLIHYGMRKLRQGQILQRIRGGIWLPFSR